LTELVQGPCTENQVAVSESKFFDVANEVFTPNKNIKAQQKEVNPNLKSQGSLPLTTWMVERIRNKCLILLNSLLESRAINEQNSVLKLIMRNINIAVLEYHLAKIYSKY
jgi:hypothetical protein